MRYSVIIPVYNRPDEVDELLQSLTAQYFKDFEVVVVEDGSSIPCKEVTDRYIDRLNIKYFSKPNSGPGQTRNYGAERSEGEYLIILDSDVILPERYFDAIEAELLASPADAFGGPDRAHDSFTDIQKAINYSMTSFFTTGGIRGGKKKIDKFYPRSFNMGVRRTVYETLGGFSKMRFGEDIDFSIRIFKGGYTCRLFPDAWVYHKRRTDLKKFFKQVHNSGIARINLRTDDVELVGQVELDKDRKAIEGQLTGRGFWHCNASRDNRWAAGDTFGGNVWLINVQTGQRHWLVSDTKMKPDHAHPSFSPDGTKVLFQSGHFTNGKRLNLMMVDITSFNN